MQYKDGAIWRAEAFGNRVQWFRARQKPYPIEWVVIKTADGEVHRMVRSK